MPVKMHGVAHHGLVDESKFDALVSFDHERPSFSIGSSIDRPLIALHAPGQLYMDLAGHRPVRQRVEGSQTALELKPKRRRDRAGFARLLFNLGICGRENDTGTLPSTFAKSENRICAGTRRQSQPDIDPLRHRQFETESLERYDGIAIDRNELTPHRAEIDVEVR